MKNKPDNPRDLKGCVSKSKNHFQDKIKQVNPTGKRNSGIIHFK